MNLSIKKTIYKFPKSNNWVAKDKEFKRSLESKCQSGQSLKPQHCSFILLFYLEISFPSLWLSIFDGFYHWVCPFVFCFMMLFQMTWITELMPFTSRSPVVYSCIVKLHNYLKVNSQEASSHSVFLSFKSWFLKCTWRGIIIRLHQSIKHIIRILVLHWES